MSQINGNPEGSGSGVPGANPAMVVARRRASVNLRAEQDGGMSTLMDPANQSLADALKITYWLLRLGMLALVAMFLLSGAQTVKSFERGVRVTFGKLESDDLEAGGHLSWPRPLGEIIKVSTGLEQLSVNREFWPALNAGDENKTIEKLAQTGSKGQLDPAQDGSLVTADLNIAHAKWAVQWQRDQTQLRQYLKNVQPDSEVELVKSAVMRGAVYAASRVTIDELLKRQPDAGRKGPFPDPQQVAMSVANDFLESLGTGLKVTQLSIEESTPPLTLVTAFGDVQRTQSQAQAAIEKAEQERQETLAGTAGDAAPVLLKLINEYDVSLAEGNQSKSAVVLAKIDAIFEGKPTEIDGRAVTLQVKGRVSGVISEALQYRASVVSRAQADARVFRDKLAAYKSNPAVVLVGDWADAYRQFLDRDTVMTWLMPPGVHTLELLLTRDPDVLKTLEREINRKKVEQEDIERGRRLKQERDNEYKQDKVKADA